MKTRTRRFQVPLASVLIIAAAGAVLLPLFLMETPWPSAARDYLKLRGAAETGARNLVSAIYLGYRAFDTLGETIVLLAAVSGTIGILSRGGGTGGPVRREENSQASAPLQRRTGLLEVVTGKLGPIVLMFGLYVMLYGHLSPGGGFQGGVVVASGIVFIALGGDSRSRTGLTETGVLSRLEAAGFLVLLAASLSGSAAGAGFFGNPLEKTGLPREGFIIILNTVIGLKVGAGIGLMCLVMLRGGGHD